MHGQQRISIYLNDHWKVAAIPDNLHLTGMGKELEDSALDWYEGDMPKQVQEFIFENGELPDPAVGDNCQKWVGVFQKEWIYTKDFETPRFKGDIHLCFNGLDTEVDVILNGEKIAYCNNMFRRWRIPVTGKLKAEGKMNKLVLIFYPPQKIIDEFVSRYPEAKVVPHKYVRKTDSDFKSYMGSRPHFIKMGIFDDVYLDLLPEAYLGDIQVQSFLDDNFSSAEIKINPDIQGAIDHSIEYKIYQPDDEELAKGKASPGSFTVTIEKPQLWYPMNYGNQPMYKIELSLKDRGK